MMKLKTSVGIVGLALAGLALAGCGELEPGSAEPRGAEVISVAVLAAAPASLPTCTTSISSTLAWVASPAGVWSCDGTTWTALACAQANAGQVVYASTSQTVLAACVHAAWTQVTGPVGATGAQGPRPLVKTSVEAKGTNCFDGGTRVDSGVDTSGDGALQAAEITQTAYVCNGRAEATPGTIGGRPPIAISRGAAHTCAVTADGAVWCWGQAQSGQLGKAETALGCAANASCPVPRPSQVPGVANATAVGSGNAFACALVSNGTVVCWGANDRGQLGQNGTSPSSAPVTVRAVGGAAGSTLTGVTAIAASAYAVCARLSTGGVDCWGDNASGELGDGTATNRSSPAPVVDAAGATLTGVTSVYSGSAATDFCAIKGAGSPLAGPMVCWGNNLDYQLGLVDTTMVGGSGGPDSCPDVASCSKRARPVLYMSAAVSVGIAYTHTCAVLAGGAAQCWGSNEAGGLGFDPANGQDRATPGTLVTEFSGGASIVGGFDNSCAIVSGGSVVCWGDANAGALGAGHDLGFDMNGYSYEPVSVLGLPGARQLSATRDGACAISDLGAYCWGVNDVGQLGDGNVGRSAFYPVLVN